MSFIIDKQTLNDLHIFGKPGSKSVYALFNTTHTRGGALVLENMFLYPLLDIHKIKLRSAVIHYFQQINASFPFRGELFDTLESYLSNTDSRTRIEAENNTLQRKLKSYLGTDTEYEFLHKGILAAIELLNQLQEFIRTTDLSCCPSYQSELSALRELLEDKQLSWAYQEKNTKRLDYARSADYDNIFRYILREKMERLLQLIYNLDVYISVARVACTRNFVSAEISSDPHHVVRLEGMYHPFLTNPVENNLDIDPDNNVVFLTGANMAGKSTFMKTLGICIFLAHMGFPVPAQKMVFSVQDGMFTTINLPDNLNMGYSHFYAEVLRVKKVAEEVGRGRRLIVIFDELFRGTNVKDAYDATVAVAQAFAEKRNCTFIISTHIIEAGETLRQSCSNVNFVYLPTEMQDNRPIYTYKLTPGITNDRHGMIIIRNEGFIDTLKKGVNPEYKS